MATRFRQIIAVGVALLCFSPVTGFSQDAEASVDGLPLKAEMTGLITAGASRLYLSADPSVVWKPGVLAAGVGVELLVGMNQFDVYLLPYLRAEAGWFHLDLGYALRLVSPPAGDGLLGPSLGVAIAPKPFTLGYGNAGFDLGFDFNLQAFSGAYELYAGLPPLEHFVVSAFLSGRIGIGFTYSFELL